MLWRCGVWVWCRTIKLLNIIIHISRSHVLIPDEPISLILHDSNIQVYHPHIP